MDGEGTALPSDDGARPDGPPAVTQSARKRQAITDAATELFLARGFQSTSMDDVAALARVSKQTVYKQFTDKQHLLRDIVLNISDRAAPIARALEATFDDIVDLEDLGTGLSNVARRYGLAVLDPDVLRLRRLVVCEAARFPDLAQMYYERAPRVGLEAVEAGLGRLVERGLLRIDDLTIAASHFAYLVLGPLIDKALFLPAATITEAEIVRWADVGAASFLKAYEVRAKPRPTAQRGA